LLGRGERAEDRGEAEGDQADDEEPAPTELVPEAAADQEQRHHREHVGLQHPLLAGEAGVQLAADRGERDVHDRRVEEDDGRAEDRRDQGEALLPGHTPESRNRATSLPLLPPCRTSRAITGTITAW